MIGHLFKIIWNRRRANALILIELLISFLALCSLIAAFCTFVYRWSQPLGYDYENVWCLDVDYPRLDRIGDEENAEVWAAMDQLLQSFRSMEEITASTPLSFNVPFGSSMSGTYRLIRGTSHHIRLNEVSPEAKEVLGLKLVAGRWLREEDRSRNWRAVVITRRYARLQFGNEDPIGQRLEVPEQEEARETERRIVGVVEAWRHRGEFDADAPVEFSLAPWGPGNHPPNDFLLRLRDGVPAAFEEELVRTVQRIAPEWTFNVSDLAQRREQGLTEMMATLFGGGAIVFFMSVMVGLGLVGVLWQSVTRRTEEIGLRRALGASAWGIRRQVLGELLALLTVAVGIGSVLFLQFPILGINPGIVFGTDAAAVPPGVFLAALGLSLLLVYAFVIVCGLYPSWLATRVKPAEALQYE